MNSPRQSAGGIRWLEIEEGDGGVDLFQYEDLNSPPPWDSFHASVEEALFDREAGWGVSGSEWHAVA